MEHIILGLLILRERTIYQLRERINKGLNLMYSGSTGIIQAAIKKLLQAEYISFTEIVENGKYKKTYSITENGKIHFYEWVNAPLENANIKSPALVKIYFMGLSDKLSRIRNVEIYIELLKRQYRDICFICQEGENMEVPEKGREIYQYQLATALYGRELLKFNIEWYENFLSNIRGDRL